MNLNDLAKDITLKEGKKKSISIAQVKEVVGLTLDELATKNIFTVWMLMRKRRKAMKAKGKK